MQLDRKKALDLYVGGVCLAVLRPAVYFLGRLLNRPHALEPRGSILVIKMQGGGTLFIALPALLGIRKRFPDAHLTLLTTPSVTAFGEALGIFDEILVVEDRSIGAMLASSMLALRRCFRTDTVIDLEVYSRLTTVFSALTMARNRLGFFLENTSWRGNLHTHLVFFNRYSGSYRFYEALARLVNAEPESSSACASWLRERLPALQSNPAGPHVTVGHGTSEMGIERRLTPEQWRTAFAGREEWSGTVSFLGGSADNADADAIIRVLQPAYLEVHFENLCGRLSLAESLATIVGSDEFWGVDSGLLNCAWLLGVETISFWGPTDPATRLRPNPEVSSKAHYQKIACSPCIHVAEYPPCEGANFCIEALFDPARAEAEPPLITSSASKPARRL